MNERIKQLMEQSSIPTRIWHVDGSDCGYYTPNYRAERFAELLIKDVLSQVCVNQGDRLSPDFEWTLSNLYGLEHEDEQPI